MRGGVTSVKRRTEWTYNQKNRIGTVVCALGTYHPTRQRRYETPDFIAPLEELQVYGFDPSRILVYPDSIELDYLVKFRGVDLFC